MNNTYVKNEISVDELIDFLVNEIYPNYPQLMKLFNNDEEKVRGILKKNIKVIKRKSIHNEYGISAMYNVVTGEILIYSKEKIDIESLRNNNDLKHTIVHETIHALLKRTLGINHYVTGCSSNGQCNKKIIRGFFKDAFHLEGCDNVLKKLIAKKLFFMRINDENIGDGINEGFTVWLTEKLIGSKMSKDPYSFERTYIDTIERIKGEDSVLKFASGNYKEIADVLNMSEVDSLFFLKSIDIASSEINRVNPENQDYETKHSMWLFDSFQTAAQEMFVDNFLIPEYVKKLENDGVNCSTLEALCYILSGFRGIYEMSKSDDEEAKPMCEKSYKKIERLLSKTFIKYSYIAVGDNFSVDEIICLYGIYDYIYGKIRC